MRTISGIKKISVKAGTADSEIYKELITQDAGAKRVHVEPGLTAYLMSDGSTVEIYGCGFACPDYLFTHGNMVTSFKVEDLDRTLALLLSKGGKLLGEVEAACSSYRYCHILTPEKTVIGIYEYPGI
jgi:predicted enzyme related to lactoylglutathione lyase